MIKKENSLEKLQLIQQTINSLNKENVAQKALIINEIFDNKYSYSFNLIVSKIIISSFIVHTNDIEKFLGLIGKIETFEEEKKIDVKIIDVLTHCLISGPSFNSICYFIENMIEKNLIGLEILKKLKMSYFAHRLQKDKEFFKTYHNKYSKEFINNYEELSKNDWELHKKYIKEGHNPNEIAKIIRKDEIEKFQEMSSQTNFDFNQIIEPSLYERCDFVNKENVSLIDYAAFFGSVKCFKYLLTNGANVKNTGKYAVASGNLEIIHLCEQNHSSFVDAYETAIEFHRNDIFYYLYENKYQNIYKHSQKSPPRSEDINPLFFIDCGTETLTESEKRQKSITNFVYFCIMSGNFEILLFLEKEGMNILLI